jgi:hypothetical protein
MRVNTTCTFPTALDHPPPFGVTGHGHVES